MIGTGAARGKAGRSLFKIFAAAAGIAVLAIAIALYFAATLAAFLGVGIAATIPHFIFAIRTDPARLLREGRVQ